MAAKQKLFLEGHDPLHNGRKSLSKLTRENLTPFHLRLFNLTLLNTRVANHSHRLQGPALESFVPVCETEDGPAIGFATLRRGLGTY
jgi:hypothetical protein